VGAFALPAYAQRVVDAAIDEARAQSTPSAGYVAVATAAPAEAALAKSTDA
jgi:hypothetical protein